MAGVNLLSGIHNVHVGGGTITAAHTIINNISPPTSPSQELSKFPVLLRPNSSPRFTGRLDVLESLKTYFSPQTSKQSKQLRQKCWYLIYGMGGIGKTQVCLKFTEEISTSYFSEVFWIDASSHATIALSLRGICNDSRANLSLDGPPESVDSVLKWLRSLKERYLLVFDNADSLASSELERYFPFTSEGNILITSRNAHMQNLTGRDNSTEITQMEQDDAISLLLKASALDESDQEIREKAREIVEKLGCLPLAVDQAGDYISGSRSDLDNYLGRYAEHRKELLSHKSFRGASGYDKNVYETWDLSLNQLKFTAESNGPTAQAAQSAILILAIFGFYDSDDITEEIFQYAAENSMQKAKENMLESGLPTETSLLEHTLLSLNEAGKWDSFIFHEGVKLLVSLSLIKRSENSLYSMHPLVHAWSRDRMTPQEQQSYFLKGYEILIGSFSKQSESQPETFWNTLALHIKAIHQYSTKAKVQIPYYGGECAMGHLAKAYFHMGKYREAHELNIKVFEERKKAHGEEHQHTITAMQKLSRTYHCLKEFVKAEQLSIKVLDALKDGLGEENLSTITARENLASIYYSWGKYQKAEQLNIEVLDLNKRLLGEEHPQTMAVMIKLAHTYYNQEKYTEAEQLNSQVFDQNKKVHGKEHSDTISSMVDLSHTYYQLGKYNEAEQLNIQVLDMRKKLLGEGDPLTINALANLAKTYHKLERYAEVQELQTKVLDARKKILGEKHADTLTAMGDLAATYHSLEKYSEAEKLQFSLLKALMKAHGEENLDTITAMESLAVIYHDQRKHTEVRKLRTQAYDLKKKVFGKDHPKTLSSMADLATTLYHLRKYQEADKLNTEVLGVRQKNLGVEHPLTITAMIYLANTHSILGNYTETESLQNQILDMSKRILGEEHPQTINAMRNLAATKNSLEKYIEAELLNAQVLDMRKRIHGEDHLQTLNALGDLARTYHGLGRYTEAKKLQIQVLDATKKLLPEEDALEIMVAQTDLANTYHSMGKFQDAEKIQRHVLSKGRKILGKTHPFSIKSMIDLAKTLNSQSKEVKATILFTRALRHQNTVLGGTHPLTKEVESFLLDGIPNQLKGQVSSGVKNGFLKVKTKIFEWKTASKKANHDAEIDHELTDCDSEDNADDTDHGADGADHGSDYGSD